VSVSPYTTLHAAGTQGTMKHAGTSVAVEIAVENVGLQLHDAGDAEE
jgi:hypothetical protein